MKCIGSEIHTESAGYVKQMWLVKNRGVETSVTGMEGENGLDDILFREKRWRCHVSLWRTERDGEESKEG